VPDLMAKRLQDVSPLAWCLGASAVSNVVTMAAVLYLAFGTPRVYVRGGYVSASVNDPIEIKDRTAIRVQVVPR
jgi:hypothetical protein